MLFERTKNFVYNVFQMRKLFISSIFLLSFVVLGFLNRDLVMAQSQNLIYKSACENPKKYSIGIIDTQFQISKDDFSSAVQEATQIWERAYGKDLFAYDPESDFTINLIYDNRQSLNTEI